MKALRAALAALGAAGLTALTMTGGAATAHPPAGTAVANVATASSAGPGDDALFLVMDTSGSMEGMPLQTAKQSGQDIINKLSPGRMFGVYEYPGRAKKMVDGCSVGTWKVEPGALNKQGAIDRLNGLTAQGETPTGPALMEFMRRLGPFGITKGTAVLVSDGEANCGDTDICSIATWMNQNHINLEFNTVSFNNTTRGDAQLACLAAATGGQAYTADNLDELNAAVLAATQPSATVTVHIDDTLPVATGQGSPAVTEMTMTVTNTGARPIQDALVTVAVTSDDQKNRRVYIPDPIRRLGNLAPGATAKPSVKLFPEGNKDGPVTWSVKLTTRSAEVTHTEGTVQISTDTSLKKAGSILTSAKHVVIMGDSYSSGEGAGDYDGDPFGYCHRSKNAWGRILYPEATMIACSGSVTTDLVAPNHAGNHDLEAQLISLARVTASLTPPDLVLLTLGGNDGGFVEVVEDCVFWTGCLGGKEMNKQKWGAIQSALEDSYRNINAVVNAPQVIARRGGVAQIVVLPYVSALPRSGGNSCALGFASEELPVLNSFQNLLNSTVALAVVRVRTQNGVPIQYASSVGAAFQPHHTICDEDSYLNVPTTRNWWKSASSSVKQQLFHPNKKGQEAQAAALVEWSRTASPMPLAKPAAPYADIKVIIYDWARHTQMLGGVAVASGNPSLGPTSHTLTSLVPLPQVLWATEPGAPMVGVPGCGEPSCGFDEGPVYVTTFSSPAPIGTLWADETGIQGSVTIPLDTPPGSHTLVYVGHGTDGKPHTVKVPIHVWRSGTGLATIAAPTGLALMVLGAFMRRHGRARASLISRGSAQGKR